VQMLDNRNKRLYSEWEEHWKGSDKLANLTLVGHLIFRAKKKALADLVARLPVRRVLEAGCGLGRILQVYHEMGLDARGVDLSPHAVAACKNKNLEAEVGAIEEEQGSYDLVSSDGMLEHFLNFEAVARHLMRVSRRYVLLIQPNHGSFCGKTLSYLTDLIRSDKRVFEYNYRIQDFVEVFNLNGFVLQQSKPILGDTFRILLFERVR